MTLLEILAQPIARYIIVPMMSCIISTLISYSSMNDNYRNFSWQLCNWGTGLITTNLLLIVTDLGSNAQYGKVTNQFLSDAILALVVTLFVAIVISLVRRSNVKRYEYQQGEVAISVIVISDVLASLSLVMSYVFMY